MSAPIEPGAIDRTVRDALGDLASFFEEVVRGLEPSGIDISPFPLSHVAYRCHSWADYVSRRDTLEGVCRANAESLWGGRPISKLLLDTPLALGPRHALTLIELIAPPHNPRYRLGLEHLGFVVGPGFDAFRRRHEAVLSGQQDQGPFNQPVFVTLGDGRLVKFHQRALQEAVELDGGRFEGFHHVAVPGFRGRVMRTRAVDGTGEVSGDTRFEFHQDDDVVWASYAGGSIRHGHLVGTLRDGVLDFRYVHLNADGETSSGRSRDQVEVLSDGRLRLHETWTWESRAGSGTSILEEVGSSNDG